MKLKNVITVTETGERHAHTLRVPTSDEVENAASATDLWRDCVLLVQGCAVGGKQIYELPGWRDMYIAEHDSSASEAIAAVVGKTRLPLSQTQIPTENEEEEEVENHG